MEIRWLIYLFASIAFTNSLKIPKVKLLDGNEMPVAGFGTFQIKPNEVDSAIKNALESGYIHFDCAYVYENEEAIGNSFKNWFANGGKREDIFVTSKLPMAAMRPSDVSKALDATIKNLGVDYLDMYLIHCPFGLISPPNNFNIVQHQNGSVDVDMTTNIEAVWKEMEAQVRAGKVKSIGLSNVNASQILRIWNIAEIKPSNLQVELNIYIQQPWLVLFAKRLGMVVTGYSPLGSNDMDHLRRKRETVSLPPLLQNPVLQRIAKKYNKSPAQIALRYNLQRNIVIIPKSKNRQHVQENLDVFDFSLSALDMWQLANVDMKGNYRKYDFLTFKGVERHPEYPFTYRVPK